jgi:hypothetical protein
MTDLFRSLGLIQKSLLSKKKKAVKFPSKCASELVLHLRGLKTYFSHIVVEIPICSDSLNYKVKCALQDHILTQTAWHMVHRRMKCAMQVTWETLLPMLKVYPVTISDSFVFPFYFSGWLWYSFFNLISLDVPYWWYRCGWGNHCR